MEGRIRGAKTLERHFRYLAPRTLLDQGPRWPPDAFALAASALQYIGAYAQVVSSWPPTGVQDWATQVNETAAEWRQLGKDDPLPDAVRRCWDVIRKKCSETLLGGLRADRELIDCLVQLLAYSDETCRNLGGPGPYDSNFEEEAADVLLKSLLKNGWQTLCRHVHSEEFQVLPKFHTPQNGIVLRSLTNHLSLCPAKEVKSNWQLHRWLDSGRHCINLLLLPWPRKVHPRQFRAMQESEVSNLPDAFGFFDFRIEVEDGFFDQVAATFDLAYRECGHIDGIILPELSTDSESASEVYSRLVAGRLKEDGIIPFMVVGVGQRQQSGPPENLAKVYWPVDLNGSRKIIGNDHPKLHRWKLDESQIQQYNLGARLDPNMEWWEHSSLNRRDFTLYSFKESFTFCTLICEDLARPEPVADVIRSLGPDLVVALLMDGPQLRQRWPARYATILADDPGCSVLTLTSLGMSELSRPPGLPASRVIALWKDRLSGGSPREIELDREAVAVVLTLTTKHKREWTADGRSKKRACLTLSGVTQLCE